VPTAEILPNGKFSVSGYRRGTNWVQGYQNVADFAGTFGFGIKDRAEVSDPSCSTRASIAMCGRCSSSTTRCLAASRIGTPRVNQYWTGDNIGDFYVGAKVNLWSEYHQKPAAIAVRGMFKLPTGKEDVGVSTGKLDTILDLVISKEVSKLVEGGGLRRLRVARSAGWVRHPGQRVPVGAAAWRFRRGTSCA